MNLGPASAGVTSEALPPVHETRRPFRCLSDEIVGAQSHNDKQQPHEPAGEALGMAKEPPDADSHRCIDCKNETLVKHSLSRATQGLSEAYNLQFNFKDQPLRTLTPLI
jgi:hypothetical protein